MMILIPLLVEFISTFNLVFIGAGTAATGQGGVIGANLTLSVIYLFGSISGAQIICAVSFALSLAGKLPWKDLIPYWISQFLGGISTALILIIIIGGNDNGLGATVLSPGISQSQVFLIKTVLTFMLVTAVIQGAVREKAGNSAGFVIGINLITLILIGGPLTGAYFNQARTLGPAIFTGTLYLFWLYMKSTLTGASLAVGFDKIIHLDKN